ncbi:hypothetical protein EJ04DRAFT_518360 [Polyplosphaeria fusca]|uniref:Uncharacterized protein n=1 Tax=Polyplosphaeria fusca TaxID=682080 RepID=A0A9P4VA30_9PLEO|nr:hypothetical protein EJ04DRAFT_518360 [Polyplosphaeria fusca]
MLWSLTILLSPLIISHALAIPSGFIDADRDDDNNGPVFAAALTGGEQCSNKELKDIRKGFAEMNELFRVALDVDWNRDVERDYFGVPERVGNYTKIVEDNLLRASQYANLEGSTTRNPDIHVRCDDPNRLCREGGRKDGRHTTYNIANEAHINFCPRYFDLNSLNRSIAEGLDTASTEKDITQYYNRGTAWARQILHISGVGEGVVVTAVRMKGNGVWETNMSTAPMNTSVLAGVVNNHPQTGGPNDIQSLNYAYGATRAKLLVKLTTQEPYDAVSNAENYAFYAQARYVMQRLSFYPNMPTVDFTDELSVLSDEDFLNGERRKFACYDDSDVV